jgi:hypothetical protein
MSSAFCCLWCGRSFPARRGGSPQRFCCAAHRLAFWSALRRWAERAVAAGVLTVADVRNGATPACTLRPGGISPAPVSEPQKPSPVAPAERYSEAEELLDDLLCALFTEIPDNLWYNLAAALPNELFDRIDQHFEAHLS